MELLTDFARSRPTTSYNVTVPHLQRQECAGVPRLSRIGWRSRFPLTETLDSWIHCKLRQVGDTPHAEPGPVWRT